MLNNSIIPGFVNKAHKETEKRLQELKNRRDAIGKTFKNNQKYYKENEAPKDVKGEAYDAMVEQVNKLDEINAQIKELEERLDTGSFTIDPGYIDEPYTPSEIGYSLGNNNGRSYIGRKLDRLPLDNYDETYTASEYVEGYIPETKFNDIITMLETKEENSIMFDSDICFSPGLKDDDKVNVEKAIAHAHDVGLVNAENKKAFEILRGAKESIKLDAATLQTSINDNLNAKAKANAVIIVNKSGFAKLDIEIGGISLVTRNAEGKFIYKNKYIIQEVNNEILSNNDDGSAPVIIGDMSIVKFFVMRDDSLEKDEFLELKIHDRRLNREVIALTTTSDSAYVHGTLS